MAQYREKQNALSLEDRQNIVVARLASRYLSGHPDLIKVEGQIDSARAALVSQRGRVIESARNEYEAAVQEERSFSGQLEAQKDAAMDLDRKSGAYLVLQREAETNRQVYQSLLQQQKELRVISNSRTNNVQLMDRAEVPGGPFSPNARRDWMAAIMAGLILALGIAFGLEYLDDTIKTPDDVTQRLRLPMLGLVPSVRGKRVPLLSEPVPHDFGVASTTI